jgi:hypothetical protein
MPHGKKPDDKSYPKTPKDVVFDMPETRKALEQFVAAGRRREVITEHIEIARGAKATPDGQISILEYVLTDRNLVLLILRTEHLIEGVAPIPGRASSVLRSNLKPDHNKKPRYDREGLGGAKLASSFVYGDIARLLEQIGDFGIDESQGQMTDFEPVSLRQKRIAQDKSMPHGVRQREIPRFADDEKKVFRAFATANAISALHDTHTLRYAAHAAEEIFQAELDLYLKSLEDSQKFGLDPDALRKVMERIVKERSGIFQEATFRFEATCRVTSAGMTTNLRDNKLLGDEIRPEHIRRVLDEILRQETRKLRHRLVDLIRMIPLIGGKKLEHHKPKNTKSDKRVLVSALRRRQGKHVKKGK